MIRESYIERKSCAIAKAAGWLVYKFTSPNQKGVPDRVFVRAGRVVFAEFKAPGKQATPLQVRQIEKLREQGMDVYVIDSVEDARNTFEG
ncbi:VRR-NUC domain-containing protein [Epibacterium ulvae]|uniref:VRR-NUC domain-containing protein n=1 Tax=Epibacterium ulvae TaxID=1156985 RepID=UPI001BFBFE92|nr:VRR-NUC domain-containing protein [Epibacterium ulvae]MBT8152724.1 VRR-NUC domain-containing protein [Epibacterium ulvae]